jgi:UDP-glucose 4-epimerase
MHALVTGGAGFLGSALVDRLVAAGHRIDVIDDLSTGSLANLADARVGGAVHFLQLDVGSSDIVEVIARMRPEVIWHLAGQPSVAFSVDHAAADAEANVVGTLRVLEGARAAATRKVVVASAGTAVYGEVDDGALPIREAHGRRPLSPHGVAKHAVDAYLSCFRELHGVEYTSLVIASVYGPRRGAVAGRGVVSTWAENLIAGRPCVLVGDGGQSRDFVYIDDVVDALARAATAGDGLALNIGTGVETSLSALYGHMAELVMPGAPPVVNAPPRPGGVRRNVLDPTRAGLYLDWRPWTPLAAGLEAVIDAERQWSVRHRGPETSDSTT